MKAKRTTKGGSRKRKNAVAEPRPASGKAKRKVRDRPANPIAPRTRALRARHSPAGQPSRGAETRARLIAAALDVFGHRGFEGATTRLIAREAGANLAAIIYHFGSKQALYRAVAAHVVESIDARMGGQRALADRMIEGASPQVAREMLIRFIETFVDVVVGTTEAERWVRLIIREQLDPTPAFDIVYRFAGPAHATISRLVATALGADPDDQDTKLRAFALFGQALIFRVAQTLVLRRLGRKTLGPDQRSEIKRILAANIRAILPAGDP
jgi:AcrR family transcriptional regulator